MNITPEQICAARALLHLGQAELAARAHVSVVTIRRLERGQDSDRVAPGTVAGVRDVLEKAGQSSSRTVCATVLSHHRTRAPSTKICGPSASVAPLGCKTANC